MLTSSIRQLGSLENLAAVRNLKIAVEQYVPLEMMCPNSSGGI